MDSITRRTWLGQSSRLAGAVTTGLPLMPSANNQTSSTRQRKLKLVVVGGHVDDPQSGCGGTMALYANLRHEVVALSLTHGDSDPIATKLGMAPKSLKSEALCRCHQILRTIPGKPGTIFLDQIDLHTELNAGWYGKI